MARESVFALEAAGFSASISTALAPVHASKREPRDAQKGKGDRDADLVQGVWTSLCGFDSRSIWGHAESLLGLPYISTERVQGSVIHITRRAFMLDSQTIEWAGPKRLSWILGAIRRSRGLSR